jgi:hypothetical protein
MFFVAFSVFLTAAIYISPMFCGSNTEKKMVSKPQEVDAGMYLVHIGAVNELFPNAYVCKQVMPPTRSLLPSSMRATPRSA